MADGPAPSRASQAARCRSSLSEYPPRRCACSIGPRSSNPFFLLGDVADRDLAEFCAVASGADAAADISSVGRALFDAPDWQARLAAALGAERDTIRQWQRPRSTFGPGHPVWDDLLALVSRRRAEVVRAEEELRKWLRRNRGIPPDRE